MEEASAFLSQSFAFDQQTEPETKQQQGGTTNSYIFSDFLSSPLDSNNGTG